MCVPFARPHIVSLYTGECHLWRAARSVQGTTGVVPYDAVRERRGRGALTEHPAAFVKAMRDAAICRTAEALGLRAIPVYSAESSLFGGWRPGAKAFFHGRRSWRAFGIINRDMRVSCASYSVRPDAHFVRSDGTASPFKARCQGQSRMFREEMMRNLSNRCSQR